MSVPKLTWAFRVLAILNALLLTAAFFYPSAGEDAAGAGLRLYFAILYATGLSLVLLVHHFTKKSRWVQVIVLVLLALPVLLTLYGITRSA